MKLRRIFALTLCLCMLFTMSNIASAVTVITTEDLQIDQLENADVDLIQLDQANTDLAIEQEMVDENGMIQVFIVMEGDAVLQSNIDAVADEAALEQMQQLQQSQEQIVQQIETEVLDGADLEVTDNYTWLFNGVAANVPYDAMKQIAAMDGVEKVVVQPVYQLCSQDSSRTGASLHTISDGIMVGREDAWAAGYTGMGMKIAVIDTGLDVDHQNFGALPQEKLTETSATMESVAEKLATLNASGLDRYSGLTIEDVYHNTKVVFGYNYADNNLDITHDNDEMGDHGTHVAGIAAANKIDGCDVVGVAPDAQLFIMKVYGYDHGGYGADIVAALEDALILGVDVVNMSLGTNAGFPSSTNEFINSIYARVAETNTVLSVSAGNSYTAGYTNSWGTNANTTSNPDNAVIGEPGIYQNVFSVASVENVKIQRNYILVSDGRMLGYVDTSTSYGLPGIMELTGSYELVSAGFGTVEELEELDLTGRIALIQRGTISFAEKCQNASAKGAVACMVYNNTSGEFGMDLTDCTSGIPGISITLADGEYLLAALEQDPSVTVSFPKELAPIPSEKGYTMSDFSSMGVAPDLTLEPDITAPGGNVYSTVTNGGYDLMSGTSMAAPNVSGITALVMQYAKANYQVDDYRTFVQNLLASASVPLPYGEDTGLYYTPRWQGSGLANAYNSIKTQAYLSVSGSDTPKASLGDDADKTGVYTFTYTVTNIGTDKVYYTLSTVVQTEDYITYDTYPGVYFMSSSPKGLTAAAGEESSAMVLVHDVDDSGVTNSHDAYLIYQAALGNPASENWTRESFRYDTDSNEAVDSADVQAYLDALVGNESAADLEKTVLCVQSGESADVTVSIELSEEDKTFLDTYYVNGGYVEGFSFLTALHTDGVDLSLPYMAFYGSWDSAPIIDDGDYWELLAAEEGEVVGNQYANVLWTNFYGQASYYYPGANVYIEEDFDLNHISVSPNGDGYFDTIDDIYISLLRNAETLTFRYSDQTTGEVYYEQSVAKVSKSVYATGYDQILPTVYSWFDGEISLWDWMDSNGKSLPNNTKLLLEVEATGAYEGATADVWSVPITVDLEAPQLLDAKKVENTVTGETTLELTFRDNLAVSVAAVVSSNGDINYGMDGVADVQPDENGYQNHTLSFDITGATGKLMIVLGDYAMNESYFALNVGGEGAPYGDLVAYQYNFNEEVNGWVSFGQGVNADEVQITMDEMNFVCAEYVGGYVFAQTETGALYGYKYADLLSDTFDIESTFIAQLDTVYHDFAYSYTDGQLYGLTASEYEGYPTTEIYTINIHGATTSEATGEAIEPWAEEWTYSRGGLFGLCMAVDASGTIYILGTDQNDKTQLWSSYEHASYGTLFKKLTDVDVSMDYLQSMTYDHNTGRLYWAQFYPVSMFDHETVLYTFNPRRNYAISAVGTLSGETCAMFAPLTAETVASNTVYQNIPAMDSSVVGKPILRDEVVNLNLGGQKTLLYDLDPWYTDSTDVIWSSSDPSVVSVDENGVVSAVSTGTATITLTSAADAALFDTCTVNVTALSLNIEGIVSNQDAGVGNTGGASLYKFDMVSGVSSFETGLAITAPDELNYGLQIATSVYARGSIWACEYGNTGMIYEIDPTTGAVKDVLEPIDGDMLFGMTYNENLDTFTAIMNMYLFVDLQLTHEEKDAMLGSYDETDKQYNYHRINMLPYLLAAGGSYVTNEYGQGASSEIVMCGITTIKDAYTYADTGVDYLGNATMGMDSVNYTSTQTLVILDNVGRLWYVDEICGMTKTEANSQTVYTDANGSEISFYTGYERDGIMELDNGDGTYNVFYIRTIEDTPLTTMFLEGSMPRITYHFSDIEFAGYTEAGAPIFAMSLYDYWNNGTTNELYLYVPELTRYDAELGMDAVVGEEMIYNLGNTGQYNIIASIHSVEVTGGLNP